MLNSTPQMQGSGNRGPQKPPIAGDRRKGPAAEISREMRVKGTSQISRRNEKGILRLVREPEKRVDWRKEPKKWTKGRAGRVESTGGQSRRAVESTTPKQLPNRGSGQREKVQSIEIRQNRITRCFESKKIKRQLLFEFRRGLKARVPGNSPISAKFPQNPFQINRKTRNLGSK